MSLATKLATLDAQRDALAANLTTKGVTASNTETLYQLVPKILEIPEGGAAKPSVGVVPVEWDVNGYPTKVETYGIATISENFFRYANNYVNRYVQTVVFDSNVTSIDSYAFNGCMALTTISLPGSLTIIKNDSFYGCSGLTSILFPSGLTTIQSLAFAYCTGLTSIHYPNTITTVSDSAFSNAWTNIKTVTFEEGITRIPDYACYGFGITAITIPSTVTTISNQSFAYCTGLTNIHYPNSVTSISDYSFYNAKTNVKTVTFDEGRTIIPNNACYGFGITAITIPSTVTTINGWAFAYCTGLTSIHYPNSVASINDYTFYGAGANITTVTFDEGRTIIPNNACYGFGITTINLPSTVTTINGWAFAYCTGLTSIVLGSVGSPITSIDGYSFYGCTNLTSITVYTTGGAALANAPWGATNAALTYLSA